MEGLSDCRAGAEDPILLSQGESNCFLSAMVVNLVEVGDEQLHGVVRRVE
jgi:hypothetical protein